MSDWECRRVSLDGDPSVLAEVSTEQRWNGFAIPRMDAWSVVHVIEELHRFYGDAATEYGYDYDWREDGALLLTSRQAVLELAEDPVRNAGLQVTEVLTPNEDGLYMLGAYGWVWTEDEVEGGSYLVEWAIDIDDAATPREAAQKALETILRDDELMLARVFTVKDADGVTHTIDLSPGAGRVDVDLSTDRGGD